MSSLTAWLFCSGSQCGSSGQAWGYVFPQTVFRGACANCLLVFVFSSAYGFCSPEIPRFEWTQKSQSKTPLKCHLVSHQNSMLPSHFSASPLDSSLQAATVSYHWHQHKVAVLVVFCTHKASAKMQKHKAEDQISKMRQSIPKNM